MEHLFYKDVLTVEKGLAVCKAFFVNLWPLIKSKLPYGQESYDIHEIFSQRICQGKGNSAEWNEAIFRITKVPKEEQRDMKLSPDDLFSCMAEFCKIYDKRYEGSFSFLLQLLESMKQAPQNYREEWQLLKKIIAEIAARVYVPNFDWSEAFSENIALSVEQAFTVCVGFFMDLWAIIEPQLSILDTSPNKEIYETHDLFCMVACVEGASGPAPEGHAEWNEAVFRLTKIPKEEQRSLKLTVDEVFSCMIEFCKLYNRKYGLKLQYLVQLLESTRQNPKNNREVENVFKENIADIAGQRLNPSLFEWDADFYGWENQFGANWRDEMKK